MLSICVLLKLFHIDTIDSNTFARNSDMFDIETLFMVHPSNVECDEDSGVEVFHLFFFSFSDMYTRTTLFMLIVFMSAVALLIVFPKLHQLNLSDNFIQTSLGLQQPCKLPSDLISSNDNPTNIYGWQLIGHTHEEQVRLRDMSIVIAAWPDTAEDNVPTVPDLSSDGHLLVLSAAASRVRYGTSITFIMVYPTDLKNVLPKSISSQPLSSHSLNLWCIFDDGSVTSAYSYDSRYGNDRASLLDCPLSPFANDVLWRYNRTLRVYLASLTNKDQNVPILKAYVSVPQPISLPSNSSQQLLTLCTSPLHNGAEYLKQWILFHYSVGFRRFVVYNTTDTQQQVRNVINTINRHYPNLVDVVQWNFSSLGLTDVMSTRYFQTEALHDCLIRYGDQSEWLGAIDPDEYIIPMLPYTSIVDALQEKFGRRIVGSVNLWSQFFCTKRSDGYTAEENDTSRLVIERFISRAPDRHKGGREKYLYRPRFVQYLSIHHQIVGLSKQEPPNNSIMLAHYAAMVRFRGSPGCNRGQDVKDTTVRDRFAVTLKRSMEVL